MNKYFKKFSIMFVMSLMIIGVAVIQNGIVANAATVGQQLTAAESGWTRIDDANENIYYEGSFGTGNSRTREIFYNKTYHVSQELNSKVKFNFEGSKLRVIGVYDSFGRSSKVDINIDGTNYTYNQYKNGSQVAQVVLLDIENLNYGIHNVEISQAQADKNFSLDAIDIDKEGKILPYNESIILDNTTLILPVGNTQQLTATTTPAGAQVEWASDNKDIATVEQDGTIKGISEGAATITAKIKGTDTKATCVVTVANGGSTDPTKPDNPTQPSGDDNLFIELVDGQIKSYQVTASQIEDFKQWYLDRDNTKSNKPYYHFAKGSYNDYVIHDKIDWFEVR